MRPLARQYAFIALVALAIVAGCIHGYLSESLPYFNSEDPTGYFWTEGAVHYRFARMVALGPGVPDWDRDLQYPEGVHPWREMTMLPDIVAGQSYRVLQPLLRHLALHVFLIHLTSVLVGLSVGAVFLLAWALFRSMLMATLASAFYAFAPLAYDRAVGTYERENFAIPLIVASLGAFALSCESSSRRRVFWALASGLLLAVALAGWHLTRFYYLVFVVSCCVWFLLEGSRSWADRPHVEVFARNLAVTTACVVGVGLLVGALRETRLALSPAIALSLAIILTVSAERWAARGGPSWLLRLTPRWLCFVVILLPLGIASLAWSSESSGYGHVYALIAAKVAHLGLKPADPAMLSDEARFMWVDGFNSPTAPYFLTRFAPSLIIALAGLSGLARSRFAFMRSPGPAIITVSSVVFLILFFLMRRLSVLVIPFLAVWAAGWVACPNRKLRVALGIAAGVFLVLQATEVVRLNRPTWLKRSASQFLSSDDREETLIWQSDLQVLDWIRKNTDTSAVFAAPVGFSPAVLAYCGRPIVVQPKYESSHTREKVREFYEAIYSPPEALVAFCKKYGVDYYVHTIACALNPSREGTRYMAKALELEAPSAAFQCQFNPDRIQGFKLVYQDSFYRLFHVSGDGDAVPSMRRRQDPVYDIATFGQQSLSNAVFNDAFTSAVLHRLRAARSLALRGQELVRRGEYAQAVEVLGEAVELDYWTPGAHGYLAVALMKQGRIPEALSAGTAEINISRDRPETHYNMAYVLLEAGKDEAALREFTAAAVIDSTLPGVQENIRKLQARFRVRESE